MARPSTVGLPSACRRRMRAAASAATALEASMLPGNTAWGMCSKRLGTAGGEPIIGRGDYNRGAEWKKWQK